jgi:hypothetical protein
VITQILWPDLGDLLSSRGGIVTTSIIPPEDFFGSGPIPRVNSLSMTEKQLFQTVRKGQRITFRILDSEDVTGYLAGLDERMYFVLEPSADPNGTFRRQFILRSMAPIFRVHPEPTFREELQHAEMEDVLHGFRKWVLVNVFSHGKKEESR